MLSRSRFHFTLRLHKKQQKQEEREDRARREQFLESGTCGEIGDVAFLVFEKKRDVLLDESDFERRRNRIERRQRSPPAKHNGVQEAIQYPASISAPQL